MYCSVNLNSGPGRSDQKNSVQPHHAALPRPVLDWFTTRGWTADANQLELPAADSHGRSALHVAPTGGGKTLPGFLPTLIGRKPTAPEADGGCRRLDPDLRQS
jgi:hypothetical protein